MIFHICTRKGMGPQLRRLNLCINLNFILTGLSRDEMMQTLKGKMSRKDLDDALEFLSGEGHIYSTTDEDHFKTTD